MSDLSKGADTLLAEIVRRIVEAYHPERVYLFGSQARGDATAESDYDLLIVVPNDAGPERRRGRLAHEVLWGVDASVDVAVCTREWFESRRDLAASLPGTVIREGHLVHAA